MCNASVQNVIRAKVTKNVALMRELTYLCRTTDGTSSAFLLVGLPMLGWTPAADGLMMRSSPPETSIDEWASRRSASNEDMKRRAGCSGDQELDTIAFNKSIEEASRGCLDGPFLNLHDVPVVDPCLIPRHGIWEMHGTASEPTVRCIDDMLAGGQNSTAGTSSSHRPTDPDGLLAQVRAVRQHYPEHQLAGWPSDFAKAYKQVPVTPPQRRMCVIAQWSPTHEQVVYWLPSCQLFGGKSPPLNFSRYPAWMCWAMAVLFAIPISHCVDDMIHVEAEALTDLNRRVWLLLCDALGWDVSMDKSPEHARCFDVIGVTLNLGCGTNGHDHISVSKKRIEGLISTITLILADGSLGPGAAASLAGKLGFALCACCGRFGRAKIRPIIRRSYENIRTMNRQLRASLLWWVGFLESFRPRPVPMALHLLPHVVSYSDGEGGRAGIGVAVWTSRSPGRPLAAFCEVPLVMRQLWARRAGATPPFNDIFLIEALGPLILLCTFPNVFKECMWLHFIDNEAAQHSLVKGSSSIASGDAIVGETWRRIQALHCWAYFDRVESEANPVDGLSRGARIGPWTQVHKAIIPEAVLDMAFAELGGN